MDGIRVALLFLFGILMIWSTPLEWVTSHVGGVLNRANDAGNRAESGNTRGFLLGTALGIVWTPCAGPVLGSILTVIATSHNHAQGAALLFAYAFGAGIPMMAIAYGGQALTTRLRSIA